MKQERLKPKVIRHILSDIRKACPDGKSDWARDSIQKNWEKLLF
jgi:hypothetical protein